MVCLQVGVEARRESLGETLAGLQEMLMYGLKGMAAYTHHAGNPGGCTDCIATCPSNVVQALFCCSLRVVVFLLVVVQLGEVGVCQKLEEDHAECNHRMLVYRPFGRCTTERISHAFLVLG